MNRRRTILIATNTPQVREDLQALFANTNEWACYFASSGREALALTGTHGEACSLFLLDAALADDSSIEAIHQLQAPGTIDCAPVLVLLPRGDTLAMHALDDLYISDVLETPLQLPIVQRRIRAVLELHDYQTKDISYQHTISRDPLIGLLNSHSLRERIDRALRAGKHGFFAHINMDHTRAINERSGYHFGDLLLVDAARTITETLPADAIVGRPYGDTFCAFIPNIAEQAAAIRLLEGLKTKLRREYPDAPGGPQRVSCCIGAVQSPKYGDTYLALYDAAETATSAAKQINRDVLLIYNDAMRKHKKETESAQALLDEADTLPIRQTEWFTPVHNGITDQVLGYEYLPLIATTDDEARLESVKVMTQLPKKSMIHVLRVDIKRFFATVHRMMDEQIDPPYLAYYTMLHGDQAQMLPQMLEEGLSRHPVDTSRICINIPQEMLVEMTRAQLFTLVEDIRALGFGFGVHNVGETFIANACYQDALFDRILFSRQFINDLLADTYPPAFLEQVVAYFAQSNTEILFPLSLSPASRMLLAQSLGGQFGFYGDMLKGTDALIAHMAKSTLPIAQPRHKRDIPAFHISDDRYNEIFARSGIIIMDWRPHDDVVSVSDSFSAVYGNPLPGINIMDLLDEVMHEEDIERYREMILQVKHGRPNAEGLFRVRRPQDDQDSFTWRRFFLTSIIEPSGVVSHVYCLSFDVDRERRQIQDIMKKAETDPLTQLFNRGATEARIRSFLENSGKDGQHALMIVDLDDFKSLNDRLGHIAGDEALQHIASQMQALFRRGDIIGRLGGDEFMVFLKNIASEKRLGERATDLCNAAQAGRTEWNLGCTVGIARFPQDGDCFQTLYAKADLALYRAKDIGKNCYVLYDPALES